MKFTEGYWEKNERANALYAVQAGYAEKIAAGMRVIATFKPILGRADELDVGTMVMEFTAAGKDRIQVTYTHFLGYENREPRFELFLEHQEAEVIISEEEAVLKSGKMTVRVGLKEFYIRFERNGKLLTGAAFKNVGYMRYNRGYATKYPEEEYMAETGEPYMLNEERTYMDWENVLQHLLRTDSRLTAGMKMEEQLRRSAIKIFHFISPTEVMAFLLIILPMFHLKLPVRK